MTTAEANPSTATLRKVAEAEFPTRWGAFRIFGFELHGESAVVLRMPAEEPDRVPAGAPLVRIHSQCLTGDVFGSLRCDCREQLELALRMIASEREGLLIYEDKEGRGIGLMNKLRAYQLQDAGADTVEANVQLGFAADERDYGLPAAILNYFGIRKVRLLSNNPEKIAALERAGILVVERVPCQPASSEHSREYLDVKKKKLGHLLS